MAFRGEKWTLDQFIETTVALGNAARDRQPRTRPPPERNMGTRSQCSWDMAALPQLNGRGESRSSSACIAGPRQLQCPVRPVNQ
ncbi:hypothetical protein Z043_125057, partial [Scleropages formosus]